MRGASATTVSGAAAREIDDDRAHDPAGPVQKVHAVLDVQRPGRRKAQVRLVHQRARVEQRIASAGNEPDPGEPAQIGIGRGEQAIGRVRIALLGAMNQISQVKSIVHDGWFPARYAR